MKKTMGLSAAIYTQTTDVEGEINGLMTYDRAVVKMPADTLRQMHSVLYGTVKNDPERKVRRCRPDSFPYQCPFQLVSLTVPVRRECRALTCLPLPIPATLIPVSSSLKSTRDFKVRLQSTGG